MPFDHRLYERCTRWMIGGSCSHTLVLGALSRGTIKKIFERKKYILLNETKRETELLIASQRVFFFFWKFIYFFLNLHFSFVHYLRSFSFFQLIVQVVECGDFPRHVLFFFCSFVGALDENECRLSNLPGKSITFPFFHADSKSSLLEYIYIYIIIILLFFWYEYILI